MRFWKEGRITVAQRNALVKKTEGSDCGPPPLPPPCVTHGEPPISIGNETFWLHNGGIITTLADGTYQALLNGVVQTGDYIFAPSGYLETLVLLPDDGSSYSTLDLVITDLYGCTERGGTYIIEEIGQSGAHTVTQYGTP